MNKPHRWRIAVAALPFVAGSLAVVSAHGPVSHTATDPRGDTRSDLGAPHAEPRADAVEAGAEFRGERIFFRLRTAEARNPAGDPNWADPGTAIAWAIDTNGDHREEFQVEYGFDSGKIYGHVYRAGSGDAAMVCQATADFSGGQYQFSVPLSCLGSPEDVWYAALMLYIRNPSDPDASQAEDRIPDGSGSFAGPVHRGGSAAPAPDPAPTPEPPPSPAPAPAPAPVEPPPPPVYVPPDFGDENPSDPTQGYWLVGRDGGVFTFGPAAFMGSAAHARFPHPVVGMAGHPTADGYWFASADGGIFSFGDSAFLGSASTLDLTRPIVGMAATPSGRGYWLVASDGGIFAFGDAGFFGSTGGVQLNRPIVGMAASPSGNGYWFVASDGGVFTFGDAPYFGSGGPAGDDVPVVGMDVTADGFGYRLARADGSVAHFGNAANRGSMAGRGLGHPLVGIVTARR